MPGDGRHGPEPLADPMGRRADLLAWYAHLGPGKPLGMFRVQHDQPVETAVKSPQQAADSIARAQIEPKTFVGELEPVRVNVEERRNGESLLEIERRQSHH